MWLCHCTARKLEDVLAAYLSTLGVINLCAPFNAYVSCRVMLNSAVSFDEIERQLGDGPARDILIRGFEAGSPVHCGRHHSLGPDAEL